MRDAKLMMVELTAEEDAQVRAFMDAGEEQKVEEFLLRKVYNGGAREINEPQPKTIRQKAQQLAVRVLRQELREQVMRDVLDTLHYLLHQGENERATMLACASANMLDGDSQDLSAVEYVLSAIDAVRSEKEKASCRGNA